MAGDWTDEQNDATVADYFAVLSDDIVSLNIGIGHPIRHASSLRERRERVVDLLRPWLADDDPAVLDLVDELVTSPQVERDAHGAGDGGLSLAGDTARDHDRLLARM